MSAKFLSLTSAAGASSKPRPYGRICACATRCTKASHAHHRSRSPRDRAPKGRCDDETRRARARRHLTPVHRATCTTRSTSI